MLRRVSRPAAVTAAVALCALATGVGGASASAAPAPAGAPTTAQLAGQPAQVTLVTGDVVSLATAPGGRTTTSVAPASRRAPAGLFQTYNLGDDVYVVPQSATPYLGSTLDLSLFDVTDLRGGGATANYVRITYRSGRDTDVPGITVTKRSGNTATGELTSPRAFGRALARQWRHDHDRATHRTGLFANVANIAPADAAAPPVQPNFPMRTLTIRGTDSNGDPANGVTVLVYNIDNLAKFAGSTNLRGGVAKLSVPVGHYALTASYYDFPAQTISMLTVPQFNVQKARAIGVDLRDATSQVSIDTPKPADTFTMSALIAHEDRLGNVGSYSFLAGTQTFYVQPTQRAPRIGQLRYYIYTHRFSPEGTAQPYTYDLKFPSNGRILADQHYTVHDSALATVDETYAAQTPDRLALSTKFAALPWELFLFASDYQFTQPVMRTEYYTALPDLNWQEVLYSYFDEEVFALLGSYQSAWRTYEPGTRTATTMIGQPEHPRLLQHDIYVNETVCPACYDGSTLHLLAYPFADNDPEHFGFPDGSYDGLDETVGYGVFADDVPIASGGFLNAAVPVPAGTQRLRVDYDTHRSLPGVFDLSTDVDTSWTVRANAQRGDLPDGWVCSTSEPTGCGVLPLMTNSYQLPVDELGRIASGPTQGRVHVGHLLGTTSLAVTDVGVKVSFDGGDHWANAAVDADGNGQYSVSFTVPDAGATDGYGAIQLTAKDAAGGTLTQTIQHAFAVAAP